MEPIVQKVGIGVLVFRDGKILLGKRKGSHGADIYACPGGHLEPGETFEECAARETLEETGLVLENIRAVSFGNILSFPGKQYIEIGMAAEAPHGDPELKEPTKCEGWAWYDTTALPPLLFPGTEGGLNAIQTGAFYFGNKR